MAEMIRDAYAAVGIKNEDGKFEFALDETGELILVDAAGTPDECRFSKEGITLSKELARIFYRGTPWHHEIEEAKKKYGKNWREMVTRSPQPLPKRDLELLAGIYRSLANSLLGKTIFPQAPELDLLIKEIKERLHD
jgi:phosphoribosylaminoimidazole-succinocarboxamide synthase